MIIRYVSDLHLEYCLYILPHLEEDKESILILAGDIAECENINSNIDLFFKNINDRFKKILYVPGNHEYYKGDLKFTSGKFKNYISKYKNIILLDRDSIVIDNVAFIGATLWSKVSDRAKDAVYNSLYDYTFISNNNSEYKVDDTINQHLIDKNFIFEKINHYKNENVEKIVVISHHAPSYISIDNKWIGNIINSAFVSDLESDILETQPDIWIHGHTHNSSNYKIGNTKVLCNPKGISRIINSNQVNTMLDSIKNDIPIQLDDYSFYNIFVNSNDRFDPWACFEL